jgi:uncharacterized protein (DUF1330 family)
MQSKEDVMADRAGYVIGEVEITDPAAFQEYAAKVGATLAPYNARLIVRGPARAKEGPVPVGTIVVLEFASLADAEAWYDSSAYTQVLPLRQRAANSRVFLVEGEPR